MFIFISVLITFVLVEQTPIPSATVTFLYYTRPKGDAVEPTQADDLYYYVALDNDTTRCWWLVLSEVIDRQGGVIIDAIEHYRYCTFVWVLVYRNGVLSATRVCMVYASNLKARSFCVCVCAPRPRACV